MAIDRLLKHVSLAELAGEVAIEHINYNVQDIMDQAADAPVLPSAPKSLTKVLGRPDQDAWDALGMDNQLKKVPQERFRLRYIYIVIH